MKGHPIMRSFVIETLNMIYLGHDSAQLGTFMVLNRGTLTPLGHGRNTKRHTSPSVLKIKATELCIMVPQLLSFAVETLICPGKGTFRELNWGYPDFLRS